MKKYKRYLRFPTLILDTTKCELKQLSKQDCFVDEKMFCHYECEILNQSDDLNDLWKQGDLVYYDDTDLETHLIDVITTEFNPFTTQGQIPLILYAQVGKDYKCLMMKTEGEWELC